MIFLNKYGTLIGIIVVLMFFIYKKYKTIMSPCFIITLFLGIYIVFGNVNLLFFQNIFGWYTNIDPDPGNYYALAGLIAFQIILLLPIQRKAKFINEKFLNNEKFDNFLYFFFFLVTIINVINYLSIGGLVFLQSGLSGYERFSLREKLPFPKGIILSSFMLCPLIIRVVINKYKRNVFIIMLIVQFFLAFGMGDRHLVFLPLITAGSIIYFSNRISQRTLLIVGATLPFLLMYSSILRGDGQSVALESTDSYFGAEYRDYLRLTNESITFEHGRTMASIFFNAIPKQVYSALGEDKDEYAVYSAYILMDLWGNETGQRTGIWGEFYLNFGFGGMVICFICYALLLRVVNKNLVKDNTLTRRKVINAYFFSLFFFSIFGSWATIGDDIGFNGLFYLIFIYYAFK